MSAESVEVNVDPLVKLFCIDTTLITPQMSAEQAGDHWRTVGTKQLPSGVSLYELRELKNLGDCGHASIVNDRADITSLRHF